MDYQLILDRAKQHVADFICENKAEAYCFHDSRHTKDVVRAAEEMAQYYKLHEEDHFVVLCAAYFHDLGYCHGGVSGHEERSANLAQSFLAQEGVSSEVQDEVKGCIMATRMPQHPNTLLEKIVADADLFHFGCASFTERNKLMHQEAEQLSKNKISKSLWRDLTIQLMKSHQYHTDYAQEKLAKNKQKHLEELESQQQKNKIKKGGSKDKRPSRGIETMFRISSANSQRLSDMADNKAHILLTVNSIILSMVVGVLVQKLDNNPHLIIPTVLLLIGVVLTMVLAILSTIPKINDGYFKPEDVINKSVNLLFFGNFHQMPYKTYENAMKKAMGDSDFLYGMLTKDVYAVGVVLGRKYKLLRYAYGVFMVGLIVSVIAFIIAVLIEN